MAVEPKTLEAYKPETVSVDGLAKTTVELVEQQSFAESGDVFNHGPWRRVAAALFSVQTAHLVLFNMLSMLFMRGKSEKIQRSGQAVSYKINIGTLETRPTTREYLGETGFFSLVINYPKANHRVSADCLTPERAKCILRPLATACFIHCNKFPAVTESIGYASIIRSYMSYTKLRPTLVALSEEEKSKRIDENYQIWSSMINAANTGGWVKYISLTAMASGCVSSKEVYMDDEVQQPGCIWWSGLHALMTDISNRLKATKALADKRSALENSNFYIDFKRKQSSRNIPIINSTYYPIFLTHMQPLIVKHINCTTALTEFEATFINDTLTTATKTQQTAASTIMEQTATAEDYKRMGIEVGYFNLDTQDPLASLVTYGKSQLTKFTNE